MSPEAARKDETGRKSDVWSIGCTTLFLLTGKRPWCNKEERSAVFYALQNNQSPPIPDYVSEDARDFCRMCLQPHIIDRADLAKLR